MVGRRSFITSYIILVCAMTAVISISGCLGNAGIGTMILDPLADRAEEIFKSPDTAIGRTVILEINGYIGSTQSAVPLFMAENALNSGQFTISITGLDDLSKDIGIVSVAGNKFSASMNIFGVSRSLLENNYPLITARDNATGIVIYQGTPGRIPKIYEMSAGLEKLVLNNFRLDARSTARTAIALKKGPPDIVLARISQSETPFSPVVIKDMALPGGTEFEAAVDRGFGGGENAAQLAIAANAIASAALTRDVSPAIKTANIALTHKSPEELAAAFVKLLNNSNFSAAVIKAGGTELNFSFTAASGFYSFSINAQTPVDSIPALFKNIQKTEKAARPVINPPDMTAAQSVIKVEITCATPGAVIKYSLDGSDPSPSGGILYSGPFELTSSAVVTAVAMKPGMENSDAARASFNIVPDPLKKLAPPLISPASGTYTTSTLEISFTSKTPGAIFIYTLDGSRPSRNNGLAYIGPFLIASSSLVRVVSVSDGWSDSPESSAAFELKLQTPFFTPAPGTYSESVEITIGCASPDANIMYGFSEDGSDPAGYEIYKGGKISIKKSAVIIAFAYGEGRTTSGEAEACYIIESPPGLKK